MKKFLSLILSLACVLSAGLAMGACGGTSGAGAKGEDGRSAYEIWLANGHSGTQVDFLEWLKGEKGDTPKLRINEITNEWEVSYDNGGTWSSLGVQATGGAQEQSRLHFQRIAGKGEYRVIGLGTEAELDIVIPATYNGMPVTEIGGTFSEDELSEQIQSIVIPDTVTTIGNYAFCECDSLTSVTIGDSVETIGSGAFMYCFRLTSVTIPDSVTSIGYEVFQSCSSLTSVTIPDSVTSIGEWAFRGCGSLQFTEYGNCKYLGNEDNAYVALITMANDNFSSYTIHKDTKIIANYAFSGCARMVSIVIPDSVETIGSFAFNDCDSLTSVIFTDTTTWYITYEYDQFINQTGGTQMNVTDPVINASNLKSSYYWYKK